MEFIILALIAAALLALFVPSIQASAARKAAGDTAEVEFSTWRNWNGDGTVSMGGIPDDAPEPEVAPEPPSGTIRIQAR